MGIKKEHKWLKHFTELFPVSNSFLKLMHEGLKTEYEKITGSPFDLEYLMIEFRDDLVYDKENNIARLKGFPHKKEWYSKPPSLITWQAADQSRIVLPEEEIEQGQVVFKWEELIMIPQEMNQEPTLPSSFVEQLGMDFPFPVIAENEVNTQDAVVKIKVQHVDQYPLFIPKLERFQDKYNELLGDKGVIHNISDIKFYDATIEFHMNIGSAHPLRVFRALLFILLDIDTTNDRCIQEIRIEAI